MHYGIAVFKLSTDLDSDFVAGTLLSVALEEMIEDVTTIEEFSADDCCCLQRIFSYLIQSAVDIFRADDSRSENPEVTLHEFVSNWMKFRELTLMVGFCLQEVSDRWADGKGPLALHFTGEQVASMVTAMFEKTSRRDALVALLHRKPSVHMTNVVTWWRHPLAIVLFDLSILLIICNSKLSTHLLY